MLQLHITLTAQCPSCPLSHSWCHARDKHTYSLRKGLAGPWCVHEEQLWDQSVARRSGYSWKLVVGCADLGVPDFRDQFELGPFLTWSHFKGVGGDKR